MFVRRRSFRIFKVCAIIGGLTFLGIAGFGIYSGITEEMDATGWLVNLFIALLGIALMIGGIYIHIILGNANAGKKDNTIQIVYTIIYQGKTQIMENIDILKAYMQSLVFGEEILIRLTPEYFGLMEWKFIKIKNQYLSFVQIHKKDKIVQYFIMPRTNVEEAIKPFMEVFEEHKAIDTSNLIDMKRYQSVLDVYKLK